MQTLKRLIIIGLLLLPYNVLAAEVIIEGHSTLTAPQYISESFQQVAVKEAIANGIDKYFRDNDSSYYQFFTDKTNKNQVIEKAFTLVDEYQVIESVIKDGALNTTVVGRFDVSQLKTRLAKFTAVKRVNAQQRSKLVCMFLARATSSEGFMPLQNVNYLNNVIEQVFIEDDYRIMDSANFEQITDGVFNRDLLQQRYVATGNFDWTSVATAATTKANLNDTVYIIVGTFEVGKPQYDDLSGKSVVKVRASGRIINPSTHAVKALANQDYEYSDLENNFAINDAVKFAGQKIAINLRQQMHSHNLF